MTGPHRSAAQPPSGARLAMRAMRSAPGSSLLVILVVALIAAAGVAAPALLNAARTATVQAAVLDVPATARDVSGTLRGVASPGSGNGSSARSVGDAAEIWGSPLNQLDRVRGSAGDDARTVLGAPEVFVALDPTPSATLDDAARPLNRVQVIADPRQPDRVEYSAGRPPRTDAVPGPAVPGEPVPLEVAMATGSADELDWAVGETRRLLYSGDTSLLLTLTGMFDPVDAAAPVWRHQPTGSVTGIETDAQDNRVLRASVYAAPDALPQLRPLAGQATTFVWLPLDVSAIAVGAADDVAAQLRGLSGTSHAFTVVAPDMFPRDLQITSAAPAALDVGAARADVLTAVVTLVAAGPLAVALVALALTARMLAGRRQASVRLAAARGASTRQLCALLAAEGLGLGLIGALAGAAAAAVVSAQLGTPVAADSVPVPLMAAVTPALVVPLMALRGAARTARADLGLGDRRSMRRRLAIEAAIVVASMALLTLLTVRREPSTGPDPLLTMAPLALAAIGCVLALRLLPWALGLLERRAPRTRGVTALVGPARARRDPAVRTAAVLAVVVGVAITIFSAAFTATVRGGIDVAAQARVGADVRVTDAYLGSDARAALAQIDGVTGVAAVYGDDRVDGQVGSRRVSLVVYVVDADDLARVQTGRAGALPVPGALTGAGAASGVPVVASADLVASLRGGDLVIRDSTVDIVAVAPSDGPFGSAQSWLMVDRASADRLVRAGDSGGVALLSVDRDRVDAAEVAAAAARAVGPDAVATTPAATVERLRQDPAYRGVEVALAAAVTIVGLLLAFAVAITLVLGSVSRGRLLALLTALGHPRRREWPLVVWEVAPALLLALPVGVAVGLVLPAIVLPQIDLALFAGGAAQPTVQLGGWAPLLVVGGYLVVATVAVALSALAARRVTAAMTLRALEEEG